MSNINDESKYMKGFGNLVLTEALKGAVPKLGYTPQKCPYGLYAEQINGTSFTKPRAQMKHTWMYRIFPSVYHGEWSKAEEAPMLCMPTDVNTPRQLRWKPLPSAGEKSKNWLEGLLPYAGAGSPDLKTGVRMYGYVANADMIDCSFCNADGEVLIVPQHGAMTIQTEMGLLCVDAGWICVIPRGVRFAVHPKEIGSEFRGFMCEVYDGHFELPPLGVIGTNGCANAHDFETPVAAYEDRTCSWTCYQKFNNDLFKYQQNHSPFDVVGWVGNYAPYRYDLSKFCVVNTVSYDHLDPSIFCVLTAQTALPGVAVCDFVIFPPRWIVAEKTFRPPYYHRNVMTEFMGNIRGTYDAKINGFVPGGASLHSNMSAHGPEGEVFEKASNAELKPQAPNYDALAFMFETTYTLKLSEFASKNCVDEEYQKHSWSNFKKNFNPTQL